MKKTVEFVAFVDGEQVCSTGKYDYKHCLIDEFIDISNSLSARLMEVAGDEELEEDETYLEDR